MEKQNKNKRVSVILADDHPLLRKGLRDVIEENNLFEVVGEADNGEKALSLIEQRQPNIAVLDVDMPKMSGLDVAIAAQKKNLKTKIIILTMYDNETFFNKAMNIGVCGYLFKDNATIEISEALKKVSEGRHYFTPALSDLIAHRDNKNQQRTADQFCLSSLTPTERKILQLVAENISNKEIAEKLFISTRTVETHRNNICQKLNLQGTSALLKFALEHKKLL